MKWEGGRRGGVEDRRGLGGPGMIGGGGIVAVILALAGYYFFGIDPQTVLSGLEAVQGGQQQQQASVGAPQDEAGAFVDTVHTSANDAWVELFQAQGKSYQPSRVVLYEAATNTGCGTGQAAMGPFYCPADNRVYIDLSFWSTLDQQLGAKGDYARAYVIAHEVGHHVQNQLGITDYIQQQERQVSKTQANALSVKLELQADCYAGVWAYRSNTKMNWLEAGDIEEAIGAASAVGDDTLQQASQGRVVPDSFTHGSSADRIKWFKTGFSRGNPADCDTFAA
ncbi:neutral zinc metallopeptidase family protein [Asticcacaulis biprosthecium C19]|uniref:Neutral zinc metallopeptidase family protein n=1 Tax=Asticcacaulis biprosthecium C19 TaxID=715226 RepID=F4QS14_9CAUL|nr:neutral zinc metallopeptidase [Asticcacaulis biprosthecium]EGF89534.1 neutral zinc metallopeptidase family protein [Asticcacaulis biprosthecium C19]